MRDCKAVGSLSWLDKYPSAILVFGMDPYGIKQLDNTWLGCHMIV